MTTRRAKGSGTITREGRGWALRLRGSGGERYIGGLSSREEAEEMARGLAGQRILSRMMRAMDAPSAPRGEPFAWAEARWAEMNPRERQAVTFARFGGRCCYCGRVVHVPLRREVGRSDRAVMDHRIPIAGGGADSFANTVLACQECNSRKSDGAAA